MDHIHHGIRNAFDDGDKPWTSHPGASQWAEVRFDCPVTVTSVSVSGIAQFSIRLTCDTGAERVFAAEKTQPQPQEPTKDVGQMRPHVRLVGKTEKAHLQLEEPAKNVERVRLTFKADRNRYPISVTQIRIMGLPPKGTDFEVCTPRIVQTRRNLDLRAERELRRWREDQTLSNRSRILETDDKAFVTYYRMIDGREVGIFRATIDKRTGSCETRTLSKYMPIEGLQLKDDPNVNFILTINSLNHRMNPVDVTVHVDDALLIDEEFSADVRQFEFILPKGAHKILVKSEKGQARVEKQFEITNIHWANIQYAKPAEDAPRRKPTPTHFTVDIQAEAFPFPR